ncbi:hypothetical protein [Paenibacillus harenae]|uniref:hypothetical protein n=1 Tax=Paenibacillus harenae TaxID=306543 RepID=UPI00279286F6|nr:hypothetical protein [Paenibacillus harenae]MDQ0062401.1 hypothetical protein [Paenibacillus harenae]
MQIDLDEAAELIHRTKRLRLIGNALLRCRIIARRPSDRIRYPVPPGNRIHVVSLTRVPVGDTINEIAVETQKTFPKPRRRHGTGRQMVRMMPYAMLLQQGRRKIRYARHILTPRCSLLVHPSLFLL